MDHAFGFQAVDVRPNHTRFYIKFIYLFYVVFFVFCCFFFCFCFVLFFCVCVCVFIYLYFGLFHWIFSHKTWDPMSKFRLWWILMHIFICFSTVYIFTLTFPSSWRIICSVSINQIMIIIKKKKKRKKLGIVHDNKDCHKTHIFTITCTCSQRLCGKIKQISYHLESSICTRGNR